MITLDALITAHTSLPSVSPRRAADSVVTTAATGLLLQPGWQWTLKAIVTFCAIVAQRFALDRRRG